MQYFAWLVGSYFRNVNKVIVHVERDWRQADWLRMALSAATQYQVITRHTMEDCIVNFKKGKVDIVLIGNNEPLEHVCHGLQTLRRHHPNLKTLTLRHLDSVHEIHQLFRCGVDGMEQPGISHHMLVDGLNRLTQGDLVLNDLFVNTLVSELKSGACSILTRRESEVLTQLSLGKSYLQICDTLGFTRGSLSVHIQNMYRKLGVATKTDAIRIGLQRNYISRTVPRC